MNKAVKWMGSIILFYGILFPCLSDSQFVESSMPIAELTGYVTEAEWQEPVYGAMVTVGGYPIVFSDSSGYYAITVQQGVYDINCIAFGYHKSTETDYSITGDTQLDFTLAVDPCGPPLNLKGDLTNFNYAIISWNPTSNASSSDEWISFDNGANYTSIGLSNGGSFTAAVRFTAAQLMPYAGCYLTMIKIFPTGINTQYVLKIWTGENANLLVYEKQLTNVVLNAWNEILLNVPVFIDLSQELWFGYACMDHPPGVYPAGCDIGPAVTGFGDMFSFDGITWETLSTYDFDNNWNIEGFVQNPNAKQGEAMNLNHNRSFLGFNIYRNNQLLPQSPIPQNLFLDGPLPSSSVFIYYVTALYSDCESVPSHQAVIWTPAGINEFNSENTISLYPNPAAHDLTIKSGSPIRYVSIYNAQGMLVNDLPADNTEIKVNIAGYLKGVYVALVTTGNGTFSRQFIVE
jgi:uncharacterized membrane protein